MKSYLFGLTTLGLITITIFAVIAATPTPYRPPKAFPNLTFTPYRPPKAIPILTFTPPRTGIPNHAVPKVIFFDDFQSDHLDRSKWNVVVTGFHVNNELQAYVDSGNTLFEQNGLLVFQPCYTPGFITRDGQHFDFISARINTKDKFDFQYGRAEARIRIDSGAGLWPAWWMLGYGQWPACGEQDIMEFVGERNWASAAVHGPNYFGNTPFVNRYYFPTGQDITHWHTYAVDWTPDSLNFSYDGHPMYRVTRSMTGHYGPWAFDKKEFLLLNFALGGAYPSKVNGIKTPYDGLPQSTVEQIKAHKVRMYVDWVKVTQN